MVYETSQLLARCLGMCLHKAVFGVHAQAPVELFKNQTKVGILQGNMLGNMASQLRHGEWLVRSRACAFTPVPSR